MKSYIYTYIFTQKQQQQPQHKRNEHTNNLIHHTYDQQHTNNTNKRTQLIAVPYDSENKYVCMIDILKEYGNFTPSY